jgi:hypothetical protein
VSKLLPQLLLKLNLIEALHSRLHELELS